MYTPGLIALDFETSLLNGTPSTEFYRADFRAISCAFSWRGEDGSLKGEYREGEDDIRPFLLKVLTSGAKIVVHNYQFEYAVCKHRFNVELLNAVDTMRLAQNADNGGREAQYAMDRPKSLDDEIAELEGRASSEPAPGLGLVKCASRWLPAEFHNHKAPFYEKIRERAHVSKGKEGANLHVLTADELKSYNVADTEITLMLAEKLIEYLAGIKYNNTDMDLYLMNARWISEAKARGVPVDRDALQKYRDSIAAEIEKIRVDFRNRFISEISKLEQERLTAFVNAVSTEKAKAARYQKYVDDPESVKAVQFNPASTAQLKELFVDVMGINPTFWTKAPKLKKGQERKKAFIPSPSFKAAHLPTYGEGGDLLQNLKKRGLVLKQCESLLELTEYDGKWHVDLKAAGTATDRYAGGSHG